MGATFTCLITGFLQVGNGLLVVVAAAVVRCEQLWRRVWLLLQHLGDLPVKQRPASTAYVERDHLAHQIVGKAIGLGSFFVEQTRGTGGFECDKRLALA